MFKKLFENKNYKCNCVEKIFYLTLKNEASI